MAILKRTSSFVVDKLEQLFYKWGCFVSKHPKRVIFGCLLITALSALGLFNLRVEARAEKLWISPKSPYILSFSYLILKSAPTVLIYEREPCIENEKGTYISILKVLLRL